MNELTEKSKHSMITRIITAIVMAVIFIPCLILGGWFSYALAIFLSAVGIYEICRTPIPQGTKTPWIYKIVICVVYLFTLGFILWPIFRNNDLMMSVFTKGAFFMSPDDFYISLLALLGYGLILFSISLLNKDFELKNVFYLFGMAFILSFGIISFSFLRFYPGSDYLFNDGTMQILGYSINNINSINVLNNDLRTSLLVIYVVIGCYAADSGAYFTGVFFGKHKMCPRISPNKTWEGFVGGVVFSIVFSLLFAVICEFGFNTPLLPNILSFVNHSEYGSSIFSQPFWFLLLISFIMPITSNIGDLMFSLIKREYNIKDFGKIFPGHGGVLDRIDSLLITMSAVCVLVIMISTKCQFLFS